MRKEKKIVSLLGISVCLLTGAVVGMLVGATLAAPPHYEEQCYKSVSYQVEGDKVVETWLPMNDYCKGGI